MNRSLRSLAYVVLSTLVVLLAGCATGPSPPPAIVTTIPPLAFILREIAGSEVPVRALLDPGASPHTYEPRPSDVRAAQSAIVLVYVSPGLDAWATDLPAKRTLAVLDLVPVDDRRPRVASDPAGPVDPHFWTDPLTVAATMPSLADALAGLDPAHAALYRANGTRFAARLRSLHGEAATALGPAAGKQVLLFHPSFRYLLARHDIVVAAVVEEFPGKEPTAQDMQNLGRIARRVGATVVFTEPQLPRRPAEVLAELAGLRIAELDPLGGGPGRTTYEDLIRHNVRVLAESLR